MPTITTALAIESLFQHKTKEPLTKKPLRSEGREADGDLPDPVAARGPSAQRLFYSPALYATPEPGPIPDVSSVAFSPTTYVINHKRRGALPRTASPGPLDGFENQLEVDGLSGGDVIHLSGLLEKGEEEEKFGCVGDAEIDEELYDDFLDPRDSVNAGTSGSEAECGGSLRRARLGNQLSVNYRSQDEYYDTAEDFFSDGSFSNSSPSFRRSTENELRILRLSLIDESSRRKAAEENLLYLNKQYEKLLKCLSHSRSSFPELTHFANQKSEIDPTEICQEIVFLKFVSEALETDLVKDEVEEANMKIIDSKYHELSRLRDRMLYYEAMNREMSQRNQETVDLGRKRRLRRQRMRKWMWSCVGLCITAGASLLIYPYLPSHVKELSSPPISDNSISITE